MKVVMRRRMVWYGRLISKFKPKSQLDNDQRSALARIWEVNDQAAVEYIPKPYPGQITHFRPIKQYAENDPPELGWEGVAAKVDTRIIPAYPTGMLVEPFVGQLAEELQGCIQEALEEVATEK